MLDQELTRKLLIGSAALMVFVTLIRFVGLTQGAVGFVNLMAKILIGAIALFAVCAFLDWEARHRG